MAEKIAMMGVKKYGGKYADKYIGGGQKGKGNPYKYQDSNGKWKKKDVNYYKSLGISQADAEVLHKTKKWARYLDGGRVGPFRIGPSTFIGLFPAVGDVADGILATSTIYKAKKVADGLDGRVIFYMGVNVAIEVIVGFIPVGGDLIDSLFKVNTRNATLVEEMLIDRVARKLQAEMKMAEKEGRASSHNRAASRNRAQNDQSQASEPIPRTRQHTQTGGYSDSDATAQQRNQAQINGYRASDSAPALPSRGIDERHGGVHERLSKNTASSASAPKPARSGKSWFSGRKNRNGEVMAQEINGARGREMAPIEDPAPARPPRPDTTRQPNKGHF